MLAVIFGAVYLDSILKSRDITLPTKVRIVKAVVFPFITFILILGFYFILGTPRAWHRVNIKDVKMC